MAGGIAMAKVGGGDGDIWMDEVKCQGFEVRLAECAFRGWGFHDCRHEEDAGVECQLDAWTEFNGLQDSLGREGSTATWDVQTDSILIFAGAASNRFMTYNDLWRYSWPQSCREEERSHFVHAMEPLQENARLQHNPFYLRFAFGMNMIHLSKSTRVWYIFKFKCFFSDL